MATVVISIIGTAASLAGIYAIIDNRRNRRIKVLAYEHTAPFPLASANRHAGDHQLSIHYRGSDGEDEIIEAAFVTYLRFANFGKEPIRSEDIAGSNPLRVEVRGVRVLDISLAGSRREVAQVSLGPPSLGESLSTAAINFDFLDFLDGGLVRILSGGRRDAEIRLRGDIIGMPNGISRTDEPARKTPWGVIGFGLWAAAEIAAFGVAAYIFHRATGSWDQVWTLALPIAAFLLPCMAAIGIGATIWPSNVRTRSYPKELLPPSWIRPAIRFQSQDFAAYPEFEFDGEDSGPGPKTDLAIDSKARRGS